MQVIYTSNGGGETDRAKGREWRGSSPKVSPSRTTLLPGGWREKVSRWCHPSPGARATLVARAGAMEGTPLDAESQGRNALAPYSLHPPSPFPHTPTDLGSVSPIVPNPAGSRQGQLRRLWNGQARSIPVTGIQWEWKVPRVLKGVLMGKSGQ